MKKWQFWALTGLGGLFLLVVFVNISLFLHNRSLQNDVNNRQTYINQSVQLDQLNREIINALANLAAKTNDQNLRQLLATHGITFTVTPNASATPADPTQASGEVRR